MPNSSALKVAAIAHCPPIAHSPASTPAEPADGRRRAPRDSRPPQPQPGALGAPAGQPAAPSAQPGQPGAAPSQGQRPLPRQWRQRQRSWRRQRRSSALGLAACVCAAAPSQPAELAHRREKSAGRTQASVGQQRPPASRYRLLPPLDGCRLVAFRRFRGCIPAFLTAGSFTPSRHALRRRHRIGRRLPGQAAALPAAAAGAAFVEQRRPQPCLP